MSSKRVFAANGVDALTVQLALQGTAASAALLSGLALPQARAARVRWAVQDDTVTLDPHPQNRATSHAIRQPAHAGLTRCNTK